MPKISVKKKLEALELLRNYSGYNPYILMVKRDIIVKHNETELDDFQAEYILTNYNRQPVVINKLVRLADWYAEKKKEDWVIEDENEFGVIENKLPDKIVVKSFLGETTTTYNCYIKYRKNMDPVMAFLPKSAVLNNFLVEDYKTKVVDFDKYDAITTRKDPNRKLREHQKDAVKFLLSRKQCILADSMGLGKTTSLTVAALEGQYEHVLIICPASIKTTWKKELEWYVDPSQVTIIEGFVGKKKSELEEFLGYPVGKSKLTVNELLKEAKEKGKWKENRFVIVNYDILDEFYKIPETRSQANINEAYEKSPMLKYLIGKRSLVIIDEVHRLSNPDSIRYKVIKDLLKRGNPDGIFESTGTPITNRPMNFYNVMCFLSDPITQNWEEYVKRYCNGFKIPAKGEKEKWTNIFLKQNKIANKWSMTYKQEEDCKQFIKDNARHIWINDGESNLDELKSRVSHIYLRRVKEDIPGMVNKEIHEIFYDLNIQQLFEYNRLWEEYEAQRLELDPNLEINKELIEGGVYRRYLSNQMVPHTINLVEDLLEEGRKVVIACCYDEELYTLQEHFGKKCVIYNGKLTPKQKDAAERKFMEDPDIRVFIGNIQAAGVGLTLTSANALVFNNISFVPGDNLQMADRIHRLSATTDVDIFYQIFRDTQYEKMWNIVLKKSLVIDQIIKKEDEK